MKNNFEKYLSSLYKGDIENFESSLENGENLDTFDKEGRTLVFYAILEGNFEAVKILLDKNVKLSLTDSNGWTPLHYAVNEYHPKIAELLINYGADVNAKDEYGNTVISRAVFASKGRGDIIKLLLKNNADPTIKNNSGMNALDLCEIIGNYNVKKFFY